MNSTYILGLIIILSLVFGGQSVQSTNGSISCVNNCTKCSNQYICQRCSFNSKCCPKYCDSCTNMTVCRTCQMGFDKKIWLRNMTICVNNNSAFDPNRDKDNQRLCYKGYYLHNVINFCEKCPTPYCQTCSAYSKSCLKCFQGYQLQNGKCIFRPKETLPPNISNDNNDINSEDNILKNQNLSFDVDAATKNTDSQEDQGVLYTFFFILGSVLGFCLACILMKLYFCIKRRCQNLYRRFKNRSKNKQIKSLIKTQKQEMQENEDTINETPKANDQQKQFAEFNGVTRQQTKLQMDNISHITYNKSINRSVITEGKN